MKLSKETMLRWMEENGQPIYEMAQELWENPELGMEEYDASRLLTAFLEKNGFSVETGVAEMPTAFVATWGEGKPVIGFSSEFDALPGLSQDNTVTVQKPLTEGAPGHGCGHNMIAVVGIFAAIALKRRMEEEGLAGTLKIFGTPAEELCMGKPYMARAGLFEGLDAVVDWHPYSGNVAGAKDCNAYFNVKYHFKGKAAHGSAPWLGRSALDGGMLMGHAIEMLREHVHPGYTNSATTINYSFPDVNRSYAVVVPDLCDLWCVGRAKDVEIVANIMERLDHCAEGAALATGTTVERELITATHDQIPNLTLGQAVYENFKEIGPPDFTPEEKEVIYQLQETLQTGHTEYAPEIPPVKLDSQPVSDASEYSWFAPCTLFNVGLTPDPAMGWHNWAVVRLTGSSHARKVILTAAKVAAATAYDLVTQPELLAKAQAEFRERLGDRQFGNLLGDAKPKIDINRAEMNRYRKKTEK